MLTAGPSSPLGGRSIPEFRSLQNARRALSRNGHAARCLFPRGARHSWSLVLLGMRKVHVKPKMIGSVIVGASGPLESAWPHPRHRAGQCQLARAFSRQHRPRHWRPWCRGHNERRENLGAARPTQLYAGSPRGTASQPAHTGRGAENYAENFEAGLIVL
jgi:hypothetical protein